MSSTDTTLALAVPRDRLPPETSLRNFITLFGEHGDHAVYTMSRNGRLAEVLESLCAASVHGRDLHLLRDFAILSGAEVGRAAEQIGNLLSELEDHPQVVRMATRFRHMATKDATSTMEEWVRFYSSSEAQSDATIEDGWVYTYSEDDVRAILGKSSAATDPCPDWDEDGTSLEYVFGFLKSHLSLLQTAEALDFAVVYGKPGETGA